MSGLVSLIKTLFIPALISLALYLLATHLILPFLRQHRQRYAQYIPVSRINESTSSLRARLSHFLLTVLSPSSWRNRGTRIEGPGVDDDDLFDAEEGEGMVGFDVEEGRREAFSRNVRPELGERRLSRDLEEGFKDDSDEDDDR